jgi:flagellar biosynthetic protein FliP
MTAPVRARTALLALVLTALATLGGLLLAAPASAAGPTAVVLAGPAAPEAPVAPAEPVAPSGAPTADPLTDDGPTVSVDINGVDGKPSSSVVVILAITALSVAPALLLMTTSFTKIFVVLSITRNALGLTAVPPNQVIAGLALFLSLFVMGPVLSEVNDLGVQPYLSGDVTQAQAFEDGVEPLRDFMLDHTRAEDLALVTRAADRPNPETRADTPLLTLIPAFVLSELRAAFIIGFVVFVPFLVIDLVVSAALMSMGMMMLPPVTVSLPFKLLLFVLVDGWGLVITAVVGSYGTGAV